MLDVGSGIDAADISAEQVLAAILGSAINKEDRRLQYMPNPGQLAFHKSLATIRAAITANRWGKSFGATRESLFWATGRHPYQETPKPPVRIRVVADGYEKGVGKILIPLFRDAVDPRDLRGGSWEQGYSKGDYTLHFKNKSTIEFMSYKVGDLGRGAQMFAGVSLDLLWFDEHGPEDVWVENQARVGTRVMRSMITLTPVLGKTWEYEQIFEPWENKQVGTDFIECFTGNIEDNIYLSPEAIKSFIRTVKDPTQLDIRTKGLWINLGGDVYAMFNEDRHFIPFSEERVRRATKTVIIDPHPSKPEAILWCGVDSEGMFAYREHRVTGTVREAADVIRRLSGQYNEDIRRFLIDPHWGWNEKETQTSKAQLYRDNGIPVEDAFGGRDSDLIASMTEALEVSPTTGRAGFSIMKTCPELKFEFQHNKYRAQSEAMEEGDRWKRVKTHDDLLICAEYYIKSDPRYLGRVRCKGKPVRSAIQEAMFA